MVCYVHLLSRTTLLSDIVIIMVDFYLLTMTFHVHNEPCNVVLHTQLNYSKKMALLLGFATIVDHPNCVNYTLNT
jgi:hypothetical protein